MDSAARGGFAGGLGRQHNPGAEEAGSDAAPWPASPPDGGCVHFEHAGPGVAGDAGEQAQPATAPAPMSSRRMQICLAVIGWSVRDLARRLGRHQTTAARWANGLSPSLSRSVCGAAIGGADRGPGEVAEWLEALAAFHVAHPAPRTTRLGGAGRRS